MLSLFKLDESNNRCGNLLIVNVYMYLPCSWTTNRLGILEDVLQEIWSWGLKYCDSPLVIGGDFNSELGKCNEASEHIKNFCILTLWLDAILPSLLGNGIHMSMKPWIIVAILIILSVILSMILPIIMC